MSAAELGALIVQASADIEQQKEVLRGLERDKSLLQRRLNAIRDPVAKLPLEISSDIFLQCLDRYPVRPQRRLAPMLFFSVCHAWTDVAISTPGLWVDLDIRLPKPAGFPELLKHWLQWASNRPLKISLTGYVESRIASALWLHSQQLTSLRLHFDAVGIDAYYTDKHYMVLADTIPREPLPCLRELKLVGQLTMDISWVPIFQLLRLSPNLVDLDLKDMSGIRKLDFPKEPVVLPNLRRLSTAVQSYAFPMHLKCITTPQLEKLTLQVPDASDDRMLSFMRRSVPPLRVLELEYFRDFTRFAEFFTLLPTIEHLTLRNWRLGNLVEMLDIVLTQSTPSLVPNLLTLELFYDIGKHPWMYADWNMLATGLGAWCIRVETIRLTVEEGIYGASKDTLALFRELVGGGRDIHIVDGDGRDLLSASSTLECDINTQAHKLDLNVVDYTEI